MNDNQVMAVMIVVAMLLIVVIAVVKIRRRMRRFLNSAEVCLVRELVRSAQNGELQQEEQPKSLGGMTSIYLPQILRDFPEFNWEEMREMVERAVKEYLGQIPDVRIHRTVISGYQKHGGNSTVICETAAQYTCKEQSGEPAHTVQTACVTELVYTYDQSKNPETAAAITCPNCGAPVRMLGIKQCEYCGSILKVDNLEIWKVNRVATKK